METFANMNTRLAGAIIGYLFASVASFALLWRGSNWRFRFLAGIVGLLPFYKAVTLLGQYGDLPLPATSWLSQMVEAIVSTLFLVTVLLLDLEIRNRRVLETRLRLAEAEGGWPRIARGLGLGKKRGKRSDPEANVKEVLARAGEGEAEEDGSPAGDSVA